MVKKLRLLPERAATISVSDKGSAFVRRTKITSTSTLNRFTINSGCSVKLGPFVDTRTYEIEESDAVTYEDVNEHVIYNHEATGIREGGTLAVNGGDNTKFDIAEGSGIVVDNYSDPENPIALLVSWPAFTAQTPTYLATDFTSYIGLDVGGNIVQFSGVVDPENRRDYIILGILVHTSGAFLENVSNFPRMGYDISSVISDMSDSIGFINRSGNVFGANGVNLKVDKSGGSSYKEGANFTTSRKNPSIVTSGVLTAPDLFKPYRDGMGGYSIDFPLTDTIDPTRYDDNSGTLASVPAENPWAIWRLYVNPANDDVIAHYPQNVYRQLDIAIANLVSEQFSPNPVLRDAMLRGFLITHRNVTDLSDATEAKWIEADKFGQVPKQGSSNTIPIGVLLAEITPKTADFTARMGKSYIIDNSGGAIVATLEAATKDQVGRQCECWVTDTAAINTVTFEAPSHTNTINGQAGVNPDPITGVVSAALTNYKKISITVIDEGAYLIDGVNTVTI